MVAVFAGDHGVVAEGVTPWPQEVTAQMVANFLAGGAAVNVLAREVGAAVVVCDVGVATDIPGLGADPAGEAQRGADPAGQAQRGAGPAGRAQAGAAPGGLVAAKVRRGTANLAVEPAMTEAEAVAALDAGARLAADLVNNGADLLATGDMGIGNTTASAALVAALTGRPASEVTGRGTGVDDETLARKTAVVERALERARRANGAAPGELPAERLLAELPAERLLAELGGLEIAALAGYVVGGAAAGVPVVVDGIIALAAALVARAAAPACAGYLVAGHRSTEPGASVALEALGLAPLLDLELRLGEGTGACLAIPLVRAAARVLREMASFDDAGVATLEG